MTADGPSERAQECPSCVNLLPAEFRHAVTVTAFFAYGARRVLQFQSQPAETSCVSRARIEHAFASVMHEVLRGLLILPAVRLRRALSYHDKRIQN